MCPTLHVLLMPKYMMRNAKVQILLLSCEDLEFLISPLQEKAGRRNNCDICWKGFTKETLSCSTIVVVGLHIRPCRRRSICTFRLHPRDFFSSLHPIISAPATAASFLSLNVPARLWNSVQPLLLPRKLLSHLCLANSLIFITSLLTFHPVPEATLCSPHLLLHSLSPFPSSTFPFLLALLL